MSTNRVSSFWDGGGHEVVPPREVSARRAAECYKRGVEAMERQEWDQASDAFAEAVKICPDKLNYRQLARNSTCKRYHDNRTGASLPARLKLKGIYERVARALEDWNWRLADILCEEGLAIDPWDVDLHVSLAEATRAQKFLDIAKFSLAFARSLRPRNRQINVKLIQVLREMGEHDEADHVQRGLDWLDDDAVRGDGA